MAGVSGPDVDMITADLPCWLEDDETAGEDCKKPTKRMKSRRTVFIKRRYFLVILFPLTMIIR
jgi:hypothetical protein